VADAAATALARAMASAVRTPRLAAATPSRPGRPWARRLWLGYATFGAVMIAGSCFGQYYLGSSDGGWLATRLTAYCVTSASAAGVVFVGILRFQPEPRAPWLLIGVSQVVHVVAAATFCVGRELSASTALLAVSGGLYLAHYPVLVAGLVPIVRRRAPGGDLLGLLDGLLAVTGAATLYYLNPVRPRLGGHLPPVIGALSDAYPIADLVLFALGVRLVVGRGSRTPAFGLLTAGLFVILAVDVGYALLPLDHDGAGYVGDGGFDSVWLAGSVVLGAAALHPTMASVAEPAHRPAGLGRLRLSVLYLAGLVAPLTLALWHGHADSGTELASSLAMAVSTGLIMIRMRCAESAQRRLADTDVLTGLYTRRFLETRLALATGRAGPCRWAVALFLVDVDRFKSINDRHGHPAGDRALAEVARRLRAAAQSRDIVARYGGEEFALLVTGVRPEDLRALGELLRAMVAAAPVTLADGVQVAVTVSVGAAAVTAPASPAELVEHADRALYAAKAAGRDRVVVAGGADLGRLRADPHLGVAGWR